jgi:hypothetical protein
VTTPTTAEQKYPSETVVGDNTNNGSSDNTNNGSRKEFALAGIADTGHRA